MGQIQDFFYQKWNLNLFFTWFQKIIRMPPDVSKAQIVIHFFEMWGTDHRSNPKSSEIFDPAVGRYVFNAFNSQVKDIFRTLSKVYDGAFNENRQLLVVD